MKDFDWGRVLPAVITPMDAAGNVKLDLAAKLCKHLVDQGCDGVVVSGTTGEAATLSLQEKLDLLMEIKVRLGSKGKVIAGVGSNSTKATIELIKEVEKLPVDGYMVVTPYYNKPNLWGLVEHFAAIDDVSTRPIMLYNVPGRTGLDMSIEAYGHVFDRCPKITAVKEASTDMDKASALISRFKERAVFLSGNDSLLLPLMAIGFQGVVSVAGNVAPRKVAELVRAIVNDEWTKARELHKELLPLFQAMFIETNPVPAKAALEILGWEVGGPRLPLMGIGPENRKNLEKIVREGL